MAVLPACGDNSANDIDGKDSTDTGGAETGTQSSEPVTLFGGGDDYVLVYPDGATDGLRATVIELRNSIKDLTGIKPALASDKDSATAKEIVIGPTSRDETATSTAAIGERGYRVEMIGEKLVITGSNDFLIKMAIEELLASAEVTENHLSVEKDLLLTNDGSSLVSPITDKNGKFNYTLVLPTDASDTLKVAVNNFRDKCWDIFGYRPAISYANSTPTELEILIGDTGREQSNSLYSKLNYFDYQVSLDGDRIVVAAMSDSLIDEALTGLYNEIKTNSLSSYNGETLMNKEFTYYDSTLSFASGIPAVTAGTFEGIYDAGDNTVVVAQKEVKKTDYESYVESLKTNGFKADKTYSLGDNGENLYTLLSSEKSTVYVSYLSQTEQMRVYIEEADNANYYEETEATKGGNETPTFWMLKSDYKGSGHNGGSSFVFRLSDGTYIVEDGGYKTDAEADQLYEILCKYTPEGEKPVISMWFITHLHSDHYGCLQNFAPRYGDKVEVKAFGYNFLKSGVAASSGSTVNNLEALMKSAWPDAVLYNKLHTGMTLGFADAKVTVICTHEDTYPSKPYDMNDTCLVVRVDIGGQRFMLLADACREQSKVMSATIPVSELESDFVQIAHHGYEGCLKDLYEKIDARVGLWTMSIYGYKMDTVENVFETWMKKSNTSGYAYANYYICYQSSIEQILVDGAGTVELALPYTDLSLNNKDGYAVNGNYKFPDYKGIFAEIKATDPRS